MGASDRRFGVVLRSMAFCVARGTQVDVFARYSLVVVFMVIEFTYPL